ncbi:MAG: hypothetical protein JKY54_11270 [Flavobacteriales bacterium]|nr:hypothetical protein [Flavobacteriales bacterium]
MLGYRLPESTEPEDLTDRIASRLGQAIHASVEDVWRNHHVATMRKLDMPEKLIKRILINPTQAMIDQFVIDNGHDPVLVWLEQRYFRQINGIVVSGQFDLIIDGELNDVKTTGVYGYLNGSNDENYVIQMSIYRWINPEKVTSEIGRIQYVFTDWSRMQQRQNPKYPPHRVHEAKYNLMGIRETELWIKEKLLDITTNAQLDQDQMVRCTDSELWMSDPQFKYYAKQASFEMGKKSTKNFTSMQEALLHKSTKGKGLGYIHTQVSEPKRCGFCPAASICEQRKEYFPDA